MYKYKTLVLLLSWTILVINQKNVEAGPMKRLNRVVREVYPEIEPESEGNQAQVCIVGDVVYGVDEPVPADQPCLKCRCQPPGVQCETIRCVKKPGCKAIHRPNKCCPDYQCECDVDGRIYANGEKLETPPGGECKVCYCRGGEVQCAEVSCYIRNDCEGKTVPGTCCPKYDHCPPIDVLPDRNPYTTELILSNIEKEVLEPWSVTSDATNTTDVSNIQNNEIHDSNAVSESKTDAQINKSTDTEVEDLQKDEGNHHTITIQEIIPDIKEIPITTPPKIEPPSQQQGQLIIEETKTEYDLVQNTSNDIVVTDSEPESSEISEVFQQPPPVLRIGDKLLFLKKGELVPEKDTSTPQSVITIIGAEGLQRGGVEDSGEVHEVKIETMSQNNENKNGSVDEPVYSLFTHVQNDLEPKTSESTHIFSLVKKKNVATTTTETTIIVSTDNIETETVLPELISSTSTEIPEVETTVEDVQKLTTVAKEPTLSTESSTSTELPEVQTSTVESVTDSLINQTENTDNITESQITTKSSITTENIKNYETVPEQNPAYPPIPDVMISNMDDTSHRFETEHTEKQEPQQTTKIPQVDVKILPEVLEIRNNKTIPENTTNSEWLKTEILDSDTLINSKGTLPDSILDAVAPTDYEDTTENNMESTTKLVEETTLGDEKSQTTTESMIKLEIVQEENTGTTVSSKTTEATTTEDFKSVETVEEVEDSGEKTTPRNNHASIISTENASVETTEDATSEAADMLSTSIKDVIETISTESTSKSTTDDVEMIDNVNPQQNITNTKRTEDVEMINVEEINKELNSNPVKTETNNIKEKLIETSTKNILKRENSKTDEAGEIFKQLNQELTAESTERIQTREEEDQEADKIFKELLEESVTPKSKPENRESDALQRVSDALAKFTLRGKQPDSSILGILTNFFSSQYRSYDNK